MAISVSFPFSRAAQPGAWGPASLGAGFLDCILSPTRLISELLNRGTEGSLCWVMAFSTTSCLQNLWIYYALSYIIVQHPLNLLCTSDVFGMACLIVIERKKLSCSSQVTLFRCISLWLYRGILTLSHIVSQAHPRQQNMHFSRLWNGMFGRVGGQYITLIDYSQAVQMLLVFSSNWIFSRYQLV